MILIENGTAQGRFVAESLSTAHPAQPAAGRSDASAHARRNCGAGASAGTGEISQPDGRGARAAFDDPLGSAGHGQDDPCDRARGAIGRGVPQACGGDVGRRRPARGGRGGAPRSRSGQAHGGLHRRDPSMEPRAAGRFPAARRERADHTDRCDDRESVVRGDLGAVIPNAAARAASAVRGKRRDSCSSRAGRQRSRARQQRTQAGCRRDR